jgi:hypothetical protein
MKSLAEGLPADIADRIAPEWRRNESTYWTQRASLLSRYRGQWIGFAEGEVVAAGTSPVQVLHTAVELCSHPYVTCVGHEEEPCQMRRAAFSYSTAYRGDERLLDREVLNRLDVLFQGPGRKVILSPGADDLARMIVGVPV